MITACFCADNNYKSLLEAAFYSFSRENKGSRVHILKYDDFNDDILNLIAADHSIMLTIHLLCDEALPSVGRFSKAMYGRFHLYNIIKERRFIYLDCDVIVNGSLRELFELEFNENYIAMVKDVDSAIIDSLKIKFDIENYYNSGVVLFNKSTAIDNKIIDVLDFLKENANNLKYPDQDALNFIFSKHIHPLDISYNYMLKEKSHTEPKVIHYAHFKPWSYEPEGAYIKLYEEIIINNPYGIKYFEKKYSLYDIMVAKIKSSLIKLGVFKILQKVYWHYEK